MTPRLSPTEQAALAGFRARVGVIVGERLLRLVLFGSRARGEGHEESDLDVLVLVHGLDLPLRRAIQDAAAEVSMALGVRVAPLVRDEHFDWRQALGREIERDGVAL